MQRAPKQSWLPELAISHDLSFWGRPGVWVLSVGNRMAPLQDPPWAQPTETLSKQPGWR